MSPVAHDPGRLRHLVSIEAKGARVPDGGGGYTVTWAEITDGEVRADVRPLQGNERLRAMQTEASATHRVIIRYRSDVTAGMRVIHETRALQIVAPPIDTDERHRYLELLCREDT